MYKLKVKQFEHIESVISPQKWKIFQSFGKMGQVLFCSEVAM